MDVGRWGRTTTAVPAALMSPARSRFSNSRRVASRVPLAFFISWAVAFFLRRRCIVGLLLTFSHRAATDRPQLVAATGEDERRAAAGWCDAEEQVSRLVVFWLHDSTREENGAGED